MPGRSRSRAALLQVAAEAAGDTATFPGECKAWSRLAERHAEAATSAAAYEDSRKLLAAQTERLSHRASAKYFLLRVEHELEHALPKR